jgi:hypothetical protein
MLSQFRRPRLGSSIWNFLVASSLVQASENLWGLSQPMLPSSNMPYVDERCLAAGSLTFSQVLQNCIANIAVKQITAVLFSYIMWKKINMNHSFGVPTLASWLEFFGPFEKRVVPIIAKGSVRLSVSINFFFIQSVLLRLIFFLPATCFGPHGTIIRQYYIIWLRLIELPIWIHILAQLVHIIKVVP